MILIYRHFYAGGTGFYKITKQMCCSEPNREPVASKQHFSIVSNLVPSLTFFSNGLVPGIVSQRKHFLPKTALGQRILSEKQKANWKTRFIAHAIFN